jgi:hypothetical protein
VVGAAAGPLADACVHPRVSAPPSSGSVTVPVALSLTAEVQRVFACRVCPHGVIKTMLAAILATARYVPQVDPQYHSLFPFRSRVRIRVTVSIRFRDQFVSFFLPSTVYSLD